MHCPACLAAPATGINNSGQIVGVSGGEPFLYSDGVMQDLGTLPGASYSEANAINNSGTVVGYSDFQDGSHAFVYSGGVMQDLNSLIDPNSGWTLNTATAINDSGQIVGDGVLAIDTGGGIIEDFDTAFLLTPIAP